MSDEPFTIVYEARLSYDPEDGISETAARSNLIDLINSDPTFGSIHFEYPDGQTGDSDA